MAGEFQIPAREDSIKKRGREAIKGTSGESQTSPNGAALLVDQYFTQLKNKGKGRGQGIVIRGLRTSPRVDDPSHSTNRKWWRGISVTSG
jgi:hypothetical protein